MVLAACARIERSLAHRPELSAQLVKHLMVGASGVVINWAAFSVLRHTTDLSTLACTAIVHIFILAYIFPLQKFFTFKEKSKPYRQIVKFLLNDAGYVSLDFFFASLFIDVLGFEPYIGKALGLALLTPLSFVSQRYWVFRKKGPAGEESVALSEDAYSRRDTVSEQRVAE